MNGSRRASTVVMLGITAVLAASLTGCSGIDADYQGVCVDKNTQVRLDDRECDAKNTYYTSGTHGWYFIPVGGYMSPVGSAVNGGSYSVPTGKTSVKGGGSVKGGSVSRGGFGGGFGKSGG